MSKMRVGVKSAWINAFALILATGVTGLVTYNLTKKNESANIRLASLDKLPVNTRSNPLWVIQKDSNCLLNVGLYNSGNEDAIDLSDSIVLIYTINDSNYYTITPGSNFNSDVVIEAHSHLFTFTTVGKNISKMQRLYIVYKVHYTDKYDKKGYYRAIFNGSQVNENGMINEVDRNTHDSIVSLLKGKSLW